VIDMSNFADRRRHVMVVYGTRPEAVKMAPVVQALEASAEFRPVVAVTAQHREMLDQVNEVFGIKPDHDLDLCSPGQSLTDITMGALVGIGRLLADERPDMVLVQGDTTTTYAAALAAFYLKIPVTHLEAGLRTGERYDPFPEELNRRLTTQLTSLHLAPTATALGNLLADGVDRASVVVTGNSVIDALHWTVAHGSDYGDPALAGLDDTDAPVVVVTAHRRESWGEPMRRIGRAVARIALEHPEVLVVFPVHRNPVVREAVLPSLAGLPNVLLTEPLPYGGFCRLMARASLILTDSGGVQEEGPSLAVPVLVMRETTERPEAVVAGTVELVGTDDRAIVSAAHRLLTDPGARARMARAINPYGDGRAAQRTVAALAHHFGLAARPPDFVPGEVGAPVSLPLPTTPAVAASPVVQDRIADLAVAR
jgi:UDP-N-acetylglucosamine 2-epimerase (non-hydrolysing)